jgi:hypothetical protein
MFIPVSVCSGRELFMADASVFVDDAEAYEVYEREESEANEESVNVPSFADICPLSSRRGQRNNRLVR